MDIWRNCSSSMPSKRFISGTCNCVESLIWYWLKSRRRWVSKYSAKCGRWTKSSFNKSVIAFVCTYLYIHDSGKYQTRFVTCLLVSLTIVVGNKVTVNKRFRIMCILRFKGSSYKCVSWIRNIAYYFHNSLKTPYKTAGWWLWIFSNYFYFKTSLLPD